MPTVAQTARRLLSDLSLFSRLVLQLPLRSYQTEPLRAILNSILYRQGHEFLLIFPRQAGKNEAVTQLLVYLMNLYQRAGGTIIYGASGNGLGMAMDRLEQRLENPWNAGLWSKRARPTRRILGRASVTFLSTHPSASARGQTAHLLLVIDEAQDQVASHIEAVFTPMRAAYNATALYIGTVKLTSDFLWQKKLQLEREQLQDGIQRVFLVTPDQVTAENPAYHDFLASQIRRYGRNHPIIASEYFLQPIDGAGGLFPERRRVLMHGSHLRQSHPHPGETYVATLDLAGEDEAATDPIAQLFRPGRDYTVATLFRVVWPAPGSYAPGPTYEALDVWVDHGSKQFQDYPGQPPLVQRLAAWLQHWNVSHLIADESGVGLGVVSWLKAALGPHAVTGFNFAGPGRKAALGSMFLSLIETGRFHYWSGDEDTPGSDGWWFWQQVAACSYEIPPDGQFDRDLRWEVPASHRTDTPAGPQPTHDDRLLSAALIAELDRMIRAGEVSIGSARSAVVPGTDPLSGLKF